MEIENYIEDFESREKELQKRESKLEYFFFFLHTETLLLIK